MKLVSFSLLILLALFFQRKFARPKKISASIEKYLSTLSSLKFNRTSSHAYDDLTKSGIDLIVNLVKVFAIPFIASVLTIYLIGSFSASLLVAISLSIIPFVDKS